MMVRVMVRERVREAGYDGDCKREVRRVRVMVIGMVMVVVGNRKGMVRVMMRLIR